MSLRALLVIILFLCISSCQTDSQESDQSGSFKFLKELAGKVGKEEITRLSKPQTKMFLDALQDLNSSINEDEVKSYLLKLAGSDASWEQHKDAKRTEKDLRGNHERYELTRLRDLGVTVDSKTRASDEFNTAHNEAVKLDAVYLSILSERSGFQSLDIPACLELSPSQLRHPILESPSDANVVASTPAISLEQLLEISQFQEKHHIATQGYIGSVFKKFLIQKTWPQTQKLFDLKYQEFETSEPEFKSYFVMAYDQILESMKTKIRSEKALDVSEVAKLRFATLLIMDEIATSMEISFGDVGSGRKAILWERNTHIERDNDKYRVIWRKGLYAKPFVSSNPSVDFKQMDEILKLFND